MGDWRPSLTRSSQRNGPRISGETLSKPPNQPVETVLDALDWSRDRLEEAIPNGRVEAEIIVGHVIGETRTSLYGDRSKRITNKERDRISELVERRCGMEPLQYLLGSQPFRTIELAVGPGVLIPRQETEIVVQHALAKIAEIESPIVVDVGTGSGAIALSIAKEMPNARVIATEVSADALRWGRENARTLALPNVQMLEGALFSPLEAGLLGMVDLAISNPPYLAENEIAGSPPDVRDHEPRIATVAGPTGMEVSARIVEQSPDWLRSGGWLVLETWEGQWPLLADAMKDQFVEVDCLRDLTGSLRVAVGRRP